MAAQSGHLLMRGPLTAQSGHLLITYIHSTKTGAHHSLLNLATLAQSGHGHLPNEREGLSQLSLLN